MIKPFITYIGGKRQLYYELGKYIPSYDLYVEPFVGGGSVFFALMPKKAIIGDLNSDIINCYEQIRDNYDLLCFILDRLYDFHSKETYYENREKFNIDTHIEKEYKMPLYDRAGYFIYLIMACYNGLARFNKEGDFNAPVGLKLARVNYTNLKNISNYLKNNDIKIVCSDFFKTLRLLDGYGWNDRTFIYFDPPYHETEDKYTPDGFPEIQQNFLRGAFGSCDEHHVKCLLSNSNTQFIRDLYKEYEIIEVDVRRYVNCKPDGRGKIKELLIKNY